MIIFHDLTSGEILDNSGTSSLWPDGPPDELAWVNIDARGIDRATVGLLRLNDDSDAELVADVLTHACTVVDGAVVVGDPVVVEPYVASPTVEEKIAELVDATSVLTDLVFSLLEG